MLVVTARLFKDNQLVGYRLSDGQSTQDFTKQQAWVYAKNKQILNVVATGTEADPGISGTNGFELKKLPEIKWEPVAKIKFTTADMLAAKIRIIIEGGIIDERDSESILNLCKSKLKEEINSGKCNTQSIGSLSQHIEVLNTLCDANALSGSICVGIPTGEQLEKQKQEFMDNKQKLLEVLNIVTDVTEGIVSEAMKMTSETGTNQVNANQLIDRVGKQDYLIARKDAYNHRFDNKDMWEMLEAYDDLLRNYSTGDDYCVSMEEINNIMQRFKSELDTYKNNISNSEFTPHKTLVPTSPIIGYRLKYNGSTPLSTYRMTATPEHKMIPLTIQPGQVICLSRAEMSILGSNPEIGCTFANGKLVSSSKKLTHNTYDALMSNYFTFDKQEDGSMLQVNDSDIKKPVTDFVDAKTVATYFIPDKTRSASEEKKAAENIHKEVKKDIFNMFKR